LWETGDKDQQVSQAEKGIHFKSYAISFILTTLREKEKFKEHWELRHCKTENQKLQKNLPKAR